MNSDPAATNARPAAKDSKTVELNHLVKRIRDTLMDALHYLTSILVRGLHVAGLVFPAYQTLCNGVSSMLFTGVTPGNSMSVKLRNYHL